MGVCVPGRILASWRDSVDIPAPLSLFSFTLPLPLCSDGIEAAEVETEAGDDAATPLDKPPLCTPKLL